MTTRRLGGYLLLAGGLMLGVAIVLLAMYGGMGHITAPGLSLAAALALLGAGGFLTAIGGPLPFGSLSTRIGLAILSLGLLSMAAFAMMSGLVSYDPLESVPMVITGGFGFVAIPTGVLLIVVSVVWHSLARRAHA